MIKEKWDDILGVNMEKLKESIKELSNYDLIRLIVLFEKIDKELYNLLKQEYIKREMEKRKC